MFPEVCHMTHTLFHLSTARPHQSHQLHRKTSGYLEYYFIYALFAMRLINVTITDIEHDIYEKH